jgi:tetratricopeptide (TPR) repeat protein
MLSAPKSDSPPINQPDGFCLAPEQIHVVENHDAAYHIWHRAGFKGRTLVHVDAHHDMWRPAGYKTINVANFISFALEEGLVSELYWVVPDPTWDAADGIAAVNSHARALARQYSSRARPVRRGPEWVEISLPDGNLTICSTRALPTISTTVLLDIDVDYFAIDRVSYHERDVPVAVPWQWPDDLLAGLLAGNVRTDLATISYSVEGEFTPLKWKYLGDELALRLREAPDPALLDGMISIRQGAVAAEQGRTKDAEKSYLHAMRLMPRSYAPLLHLVYLYANANRIDEAKTMFRRAISLGGESALRRSHGFGDLWCGNHDQAEREFRLMNVVDPENPLAWLGLGLVESRRANWDAAAAALNRAIDLDSNSIDTHRAIAEVLTHQKKNKNAIAAYEHSIKLALTGYRPLKALAITEVPKDTLLDPDHRKTYEQLANLYELEGDHGRAIQACQFGLVHGANSGGLRWRLARLYFKTWQWRPAFRETWRAIVAGVSTQADVLWEALNWTAAKLSARLSLIRGT